MNKLFEVIDKKEVNSSERSIVAWGSRPVMDRDHERIHEKAKWKLDNFKLNPVLMLSHDYSRPPVGRVLWTKVTDEGLRFKAQFANTPIGNELFQLYKEGIMSSFSIGFVPMKWTEPEEYKSNEPRRTYTELELLEISCVSVPSCPLANLIEATEKGFIKTKDFTDYIEFMKSQEIQDGKQEIEFQEETKEAKAESGDIGSSQEEEIVFEFIKKELVTKPDTENIIHIPAPGQEGKHSGHKIRTFVLSAKQGISAHYCIQDKVITGYLFKKDQWTHSEAQAWVDDHNKSIEDYVSKQQFDENIEDENIEFCLNWKSYCTCDEFDGDDEYCKACGGKRKPKKEIKELQCQCSECGNTWDPVDGKCDMKCPECGGSMSMNDDSEDNAENDAYKPEKPEKEINELDYNITDEEIENLVSQFEKMLDTQPVQKEVEVSELVSIIESMNSVIEDLKSEIKELKFGKIKEIHHVETKINDIQPNKQKVEIAIEALKSLIVEDNTIVTDTFIQLENDEKVEKSFIEIEQKEVEELEFDTDKVLSIVEKSLDKIMNTKYIDVDDLVYESLMKAKGKMFY